MMQSLLFEFSHVWLLYDTDTGLARIRERALARSQRQEGEGEEEDDGEEEHDGEVRREMFRRKNHCHRKIRYVNDHMHSSLVPRPCPAFQFSVLQVTKSWAGPGNEAT